MKTGANDKPEKAWVIEDCGEVPADEDLEKLLKKEPDSTGDTYEDFPEDQKEKGEEWKGEQIVKIATELKAMGSKAFTEKPPNNALALSKYQKALRYLHVYPEPLENDPPELGSQLNKLKIALHNNSSLLQYKMGQFKDSDESADKSLEVAGITDGEKSKALFRKGVAAKELKNEDDALKYLEEASALNSADAGIKTALASVKKAAADRRAKERKAYSKMFDD